MYVFEEALPVCYFAAFEWHHGRVCMVHKRSKDKLLLRKIHKIIINHSYNDRLICETVSRVTRQDVLAYLDEPVRVSDVPDVEKGEVLIDCRGTGSFQSLPEI
jgi:hypothetical protein